MKKKLAAKIQTTVKNKAAERPDWFKDVKRLIELFLFDPKLLVIEACGAPFYRDALDMPPCKIIDIDQLVTKFKPKVLSEEIIVDPFRSRAEIDDHP